MKHLRLFDGYLDSSETLYKEIEWSEYYKNVALDRFGEPFKDRSGKLIVKEHKPVTNFRKTEIDMLNSLMVNNPNIMESPKSGYNKYPSEIYGVLDYFEIYKRSGFDIRYLITKTEDDWFWVIYFDSEKDWKHLYRCDQFEGLLQFLTDKGIIKNEFK